MYRFNHKNLLGMDQLSVSDINLILDTADSLMEISSRDIKKVPTLRGKSIINFFYEPSTRTKASFEMAAKRLSADTLSLSATDSSMVKGETLIDTARNLQAMNPDIIILRHSSSGAPHLLAQYVNAGVINAGDGTHEHPTQALLDLFTIKKKKGRIKGLQVVIIGDIAHSRVARSDIIGLRKMGAEVTISGPPTMIPVDVESLGVKVILDPVKAVKNKDVIMLLRVQLERQDKVLFPSLREYAIFFGLNTQLIKGAKKDVIIMHPGPINRGVEITGDLADGPFSVILDQVSNGVAIRMALLYLLIGGG
ncbi:MAG: aspartate carbamoyltransferase [Deltaproteobacteria bacterium]|nr:aspartate carbamoyltransferase catalytic subunit [Deltaproteobacteria bacterium]OQY16326.1 MAG: aspartate carbamoyltransferase [Desulfobacterium sp. 4572_20]HDH86999.1 aspartate carbamoyltransferase catalytic subunit [Desulfobacteraceae bacterium]MCD6265644.1 aspartate carbamoyltransferase catalytic subunit [Deltaproteobacteria bacterium]RLB18367.1 MAG: aspartate carbamoyltransferase [Deltaproteobacteria bacterium]